MRDEECRRFIAGAGRPSVAAQLERCFRGLGAPRSVALVGLPGFLVSEQLGAALQVAEKAGDGLHGVLRIRGRDLQRPEEIVAALRRLADPDPASEAAGSLPEALTALRDAVGSGLPRGRKILLVLSGFHELLEVQDRAGLQEVLDFWQAAATEGGEWLAIAACSYVPPARICGELGWSAFYKVFGIRVLFAGLLEEEPAARAIAALLKQHAVEGADEAARSILRQAEGIPALAAELTAQATAGDRIEGPSAEQLEGLKARLLRFVPGDCSDFLRRGEHPPRPLDRDRNILRDCARLGLVRILHDGSWEPTLVAPAGPSVDREIRDPAEIDPRAAGFVRGDGALTEHEQDLVRRAARDTHYTQVHVLQRRDGEALVLRLDREDDSGQVLRPRVLKITAMEKLRKEEERTRRAGVLLGPACPAVVELLDAGAMGGLVVELACADNRDYQVRTLQELFEGAVGSPTASVTAKSSGGRRSSVEAFLKRLLGSVMAPLYRDPVQQQRRINHLYAVPKPAETQDLREICDKYLEGAREDLLFTGLGECAALQDGSSKLLGAVQTDFRDPRPILICSAIHGDLNPRNCLIDGAENVHLIDFASLGEGALAKDFARIECEILFRLASCSGARGYYSLLPILLGPPDLVTASQRTACLPLSEPMLSAAAAVLAVRMEFMAYGATRSSRRELQQDYAAALSATAVRLALFTDYLTDVQTSAALVYALLALDKLRGDS